MSISNLLKSEQPFDLFGQEASVIQEASRFLAEHPDDLAGLHARMRALIQAFQLSARLQRQLVRAGDRQQEQLRLAGAELREKSRLLEEQARHLRVLNTSLAHEVEARKTLEVELRILATTDPLTGVYNRRRFQELGEYELAREQRNRRGLCLLALDLDHFKRVNDTHGHGVGDETLVRLVQTCSTCLRAMDTIGRTGGEEFSVLLPETPLQAALEVAERMRQAVADCVMLVPSGCFHVTVSIGAAQLEEGEGFEALMARADQHLYCAKHAGRNRVYWGPESAEQWSRLQGQGAELRN
jgi:diguanylate cyclase (GGDEF)-like protein